MDSYSLTRIHIFSAIFLLQQQNLHHATKSLAQRRAFQNIYGQRVDILFDMEKNGEKHRLSGLSVKTAQGTKTDVQ